MHIKKQRLLTPGPTPLYPPALHAMMASDIHHRTEDFRNVYKSALADLKEALGTSHDVLIFASSGTVTFVVPTSLISVVVVRSIARSNVGHRLQPAT